MANINLNKYILILFYGEKNLWLRGIDLIPKSASVILLCPPDVDEKEIDESFDPVLKKHIRLTCRIYQKEAFPDIQKECIKVLKDEISEKQNAGEDTRNYLQILLCTEKWRGLTGQIKASLDGSFANLGLSHELTKKMFKAAGNPGQHIPNGFAGMQPPPPEERSRALEREKKKKKAAAAKEEKTPEPLIKENLSADPEDSPPVLESEENDEPYFFDEPEFAEEEFLGPPDDFLGPPDEEIESVPEDIIEEVPPEEEKEEAPPPVEEPGRKEAPKKEEKPADPPRASRIVMPNINREKEPQSEKTDIHDAVFASLGTIAVRCKEKDVPFFSVAGTKKGSYRVFSTEEVPESIAFAAAVDEDYQDVDEREDLLEQLMLVAHGYSATPSRITEVRDAKAYLINALQIRIKSHADQLKRGQVKQDTVMHFITLLDKTEDMDIFNDLWKAFVSRTGKNDDLFKSEEDYNNLRQEARYYILLLKFLYSGDPGINFQRKEEE